MDQLAKLTPLVKKYHYAIVGGLLLLMFVLGVTSMAHDSAIVDEVAHIPAGYSYLHYSDYRLNPEHPPLIKELAGLPLQFMQLTFPVALPAWTTDVNGQWESGWHFLYHDGNNADRMLFFSRLPILLLAVLFGYIFYEVIRRKFGLAVGLLALFLYVLEPNILAHARLVTTDIGAMALIFVAVVTFVRFLQKPSMQTGVLATICFALAQLAKFSAVLLAPVYILLVVYAVFGWDTYHDWKGRLKVYLPGLMAIGFGGLLLIWLYYIPIVAHMPADVQTNLIKGSLIPGIKRTIALKVAGLNHIIIFRALAQYVLGIMMVFNRVAGGNTTYFLGHVTNQSFFWYFPVTYLIKTPVAMLLLVLTSIYIALTRYLNHKPKQIAANFKRFSQKHFLRLAAITFIVVYGYFSITGNLNLGIRHLLPMFPFIILLVAYEVISLGREFNLKRAWPVSTLAVLMIYYAVANFTIYPSYIAYFNELMGGPNNAFRYVTDSSIDWGQDLVRLKDYVYAHPEIKHIAVDYFGGGEPRYYFCSRKFNSDGSLIKSADGYDCSKSVYTEWHAQYGNYSGQYMAVSETYLMNDLYESKKRHDSGYNRLRGMTPIAKIGHSIYVYKMY